MTPKSTLRAEPACSPVEELAGGMFRPVLADDQAQNVRGVILCSGKIAHELRAERAARGAMDRAIVTIEQFYPFPADALKEALARHPSDAKITWVQEEPANMGALAFVRHRIKESLGGRYVTSVKRYESASPATGSAKAHALEQKALIRLALA
jgi:2-oxoglutarate dehydrogenase E1 component